MIMKVRRTLSVTEDKEKKRFRLTMASTFRLFKYLKPYWHWALLAPLLMVLEVWMDLLQPKLIERIVDVGIAQGDLTVVTRTGLTMLGVALVGAVGGGGCTVFSVLASLGFGTDLRDSLYRKVQSLSFENIDQLETGRLVTRLTNDITQVQGAVMMMLRVLVRAPMMLIGSLFMAITTSPGLAWLVIGMMPLVGMVIAIIIRKAFPLFQQVQTMLDGLNTVMQENLMGVRVVKAFVRAEHEEGRFRETNESLMELAIKASRLVGLGFPLMMLLVNVGIVGALWFGGNRVISGDMQVGQVIAFINYLMRTLFSLMFVSFVILHFSRAEASSQRIEEVLDAEATIKMPPEARSFPKVNGRSRGRVSFEGVTFAYAGEEHEPVLQDVDLVAEPGQTVALMGATGSGKSTLVHLIPRYYDVSAGRVTIDGVDVRELDLTALRQNVAVAFQEPILFSGTIRDNLRYGRPDATNEAVETAARIAQAHDFIMSLPDGYETVLGQRGVNLSGGQKQRLAIARALVTNPAVLILDDSTSSVDVETEAKMQEAFNRFAQDRTTFLIAQRVSSVLTADKILVLDGGKIAAEGTHSELLDTSDIYREIYASQLGDGEDAHG
jgi:ATP-binding cassette, subfamily B, multidrug efflux pump